MERFRYPTLIPLPDELRSSRLVLSPYHPADADQLFAAIEESREHLRPWVGWVDRYASVDDAREYCARSAANWILRADFAFAIFDATGGQYLGDAGAHPRQWDVYSQVFEISYWLREAVVGRGFVSEAVRLVVDMAFAHLAARRVEIRCDPRNERSRSVAERVGFVLEGQLSDTTVGPDGQPSDELVFALTLRDLARPIES